MNTLKRIFILAERNVKEIVRDPLSLIFSFALPEAMLIIFYFAFHTMTSQFQMRLLCPCIIVFAQAFLTLFMGLLLTLDRENAYNTRLYMSGAKAGDFVLGYALAILPVAAIQSALILLTGVVIEPDFASFNLFSGFAFSIISSVLFIGFGVLFGSLVSAKAIGGACSIIITGQSLLSGMWFPTEGLSQGFITVMKVLPFKNAADILYGSANGIYSKDFVTALIITIAYTVTVFFFAVISFKRQMKKG